MKKQLKPLVIKYGLNMTVSAFRLLLLFTYSNNPQLIRIPKTVLCD